MDVHGSDINLPALSKVKSLADLKKLNIYSHLPNEDEANEILWKTLKPETSKPKLTEDLPDDGND